MVPDKEPLSGPRMVPLRHYVAAVPTDWRKYKIEDPGVSGTCFWRYWSGFSRYEIFDAASGLSNLLLDSPAGTLRRPVWSPDSRSVVLSNVFLPLNAVDPLENAKRMERPITVEVDIDALNVRRIGDRCLYALNWDPITNELTCTEKPDQDAELFTGVVKFRKGEHGWNELPAEASSTPTTEVALREDMNSPPKIYVRKGNEEHLLLDLNPNFDRIEFARAEEMKWEWGSGHTGTGVLYYPVHYRAGQLYPLVIQTHGYKLTVDRFRIEGVSTTGYAAQALAGRGIFVLQTNDISLISNAAAKQEMSDAMQFYGSAIVLLVKRRMIDGKRVGVLGWSHTEDYVTWALTHDPSLFSAAVLSGESSGGYFQFMSRMGGGNSNFTSLYGGPPFGQQLAEWVKDAPSFNLDRVQVPVLMNVLSTRLWLPMEWEWYEGLRLLHKPVEMLMLENAQHVLIKPAERMVVSGGTVDWFDFWLNGHEDPDPSKNNQYGRWRKLRELRDRDLKPAAQEH